MKKSKLITLLSAFTKEEIKVFEKFISSPYFNNGRNFKPLYKILKAHHPEFDDPDLTEEKLFKKLYPKKIYDKKSAVSIRVLESQLAAMAERFLQIEEFERDDSLKRSAYLHNLNRKGKYGLVTEYAKKFLNELDAEKIGFSHYFSQYLLRQEVGAYHFETNSRESEFLENNIVRKIDSALLIFISKLIYFYEELSVYPSKKLPESELLNEFENCFDVEKFMSNIKQSNLLDSDYLLMLFYSYKITVDRKDGESYKNLKDLLFKLKDKINYYFEFEFFIKLMNFCSFQQLGEKDHYHNQYLEIYNVLIKDAPKERYEDVFNLRAVRNFVRMMVYFGRFDELENYIKSYSQHFSEDIKEDCINYAHVSIAFTKNNFEECLETISKHTFNIPMMIKDMKIMKLQSCYELCYYESLYSEIDSYRHFLSATLGIPKDFIENDKRFLKYFHRLARIKEKRDLYALHELNDDLKKLNSSNIFINWIELKIKELKLDN